MTRFAIISAVARNGVVGIDNKLPWHLPEDLKRFKALTMGAPMLMGRKTFESLPGLLPGRRHLVITRNADWSAPGAEVFGSLAAAMAACGDVPTAFVIGGGEIYTQALPLVDTLCLTEVDLAPEGDAWFPEFDRSEWQEAEREAHTSTNGIGFAFVTYQRAA
ncbi:dihydrofolate reductase [Andreprevotia lacus DSM 23236]|jgi:dihydrofolate reductase|uniref:Dihydrofolate reductase n=1 Tax=Andreprevotia lacus DSM 23236 TaxID=1121001 RepID=A0A1W1XEI0_9NEIS|nr:dihydrofolate reductase [Andreprevotia lacus]SMC22290.1 dihydrofolate reductase [Andreprevotia lacus DSM 23236]